MVGAVGGIPLDGVGVLAHSRRTMASTARWSGSCNRFCCSAHVEETQLKQIGRITGNPDMICAECLESRVFGYCSARYGHPTRYPALIDDVQIAGSTSIPPPTTPNRRVHMLLILGSGRQVQFLKATI